MTDLSKLRADVTGFNGRFARSDFSLLSVEKAK